MDCRSVRLGGGVVLLVFAVVGVDFLVMILILSLCPGGPAGDMPASAPSGAVSLAGHRRERKALRTAVVRERSDPVPSEPEALRLLRSGACSERRPAQTARIRGGDARHGTAALSARQRKIESA